MELRLLLAVDIMSFLEQLLLLLFFLFYSTEVQSEIRGGVPWMGQVFVGASVVRAADVGGTRLSGGRHVIVIVYQPITKLTVGAVLRNRPLLTAILHFRISY